MLIAVLFFACSEKKEDTGSAVGQAEEKNALDFSMEQDKTPYDAAVEEPQLKITVSLEVISETFSGNVPVHKPSTLIASYISGTGESAMATLVTKDDMDSVIRFYRGILQEKGWVLSGETSIPGAHLLKAERNDISINVAIKEIKENTQFTLAITREE